MAFNAAFNFTSFERDRGEELYGANRMRITLVAKRGLHCETFSFRKAHIYNPAEYRETSNLN